MSIEVNNINKSFGEKRVLQGITLTLEKGKVNMIIGASGSGKSVMLKCIVGLVKPDEGEILYDGVSFHSSEPQEQKLIRRKMGMLFQGSALFDSMTAWENVAYPLRMITALKPNEIKDRVAFCLDRVRLTGVDKLYPSELSGGMQKRVGIARAISLNPQYLFVDEPNSGLDPPTASVIDELIQEITYEYNMTTVVVSHDLNSVLNIGDHIMFLYQGKKEWEGTNKEILGTDKETLQKFIFVSDFIRNRISSQ